MSLVTESIRGGVKDNLIDIGECVNGIAVAYTPKKSIHRMLKICVPEAAIWPEGFEEFSVAMITEMVRNIDSMYFRPLERDRNDTYNIVFRWLSIEQKDGKYEYCIRCAIESATTPDVFDMNDERKVNVI